MLYLFEVIVYARHNYRALGCSAWSCPSFHIRYEIQIVDDSARHMDVLRANRRCDLPRLLISQLPVSRLLVHNSIPYSPAIYRGGSLYQPDQAACRYLNAKVTNGLVQMRIRHRGQRFHLREEGIT
jgi:hypothetical protein